MEIFGRQGKDWEFVQIMHFLGLFIHQGILIKTFFFCSRELGVSESLSAWFQGAPEPGVE